MIDSSHGGQTRDGFPYLNLVVKELHFADETHTCWYLLMRAM
jgi:hypothetical protein